MPPVIEFEGLTVSLGGREILHGLSGTLNGKAIGLLGPNGAGKSTFINTILSFHKPTSGSLRVHGRDVFSATTAVRRMIGYMPENEAFIAGMSGVRFVRYMAELAGLPPDEALERAHEAFFYVGLGEARYRKLGTYSLGMKQLAKLAQAIAHGPHLLLLDEPTNGLDPPARLRMLQLIREIRDTPGMNIILSSHLLHDVEECCDEVMILNEGRVAAICNLEDERKANRKFLELETTGDENAFAQAAEHMGCECALFSRGRMKIVMPQEVELRQIYQLASEKGVQIRRMNHRRDSLEDIFLRAMEEPVTQAAPKIGAASGSL